MRVHKHINYHCSPDYPGGGKMKYKNGEIFSANFDINLCDGMALSKGTRNDDEVTCKRCLSKLRKKAK